MSNIPFISTWLVGFMNGCNDNGIPNYIKYGTMTLTATINSGVSYTSNPNANSHLPPVVRIGSIALGSSLVAGSIFCFGNFVGKSVNYIDTQPIR